MPKRSKSGQFVKRTRRRVSHAVKGVRRRLHKQPISLLTTLPVVQKAIIEPVLGDNRGIYGAGKMIQEGRLVDGIKEFTDVIGINFLGYKFSDGSMWLPNAIDTYKGIGLGYAGSKVLTKIGVNRQFKKLPFIGKSFKL